jgi:tRNA pseudouridine32 synthase/23S rRNA pseudouridine746 synthase
MPEPAILTRTPGLVILNKPAGLPCHPGPRGGPSVEDWFPMLSRRRDGPWLAHRLDADTAGCLVVALRKRVLLTLQAEFAAGRVEKTYWAVVRGQPAGAAGMVDLPLAKRSDRRGWRIVVDPAGAPAVTEWRLRGASGGVSWLELRPRTGRTHQVRVHCATLGCPIIGDPIYMSNDGNNGRADGRLHLLARTIRLPLDPIAAAKAPVPTHMAAALALCGWTEQQPVAQHPIRLNHPIG